MIQRYNEFLNERKQRGVLYHYTSLSGLVSVLTDNIIKPRIKNAPISLTRDQNFHKVFRAGVETNVRLALDGDKITDQYAVRPYTDFKDSKVNVADKKLSSDLSYVECEEIIREPLLDVRKYLLAIDFNEDSFRPRTFRRLEVFHADVFAAVSPCIKTIVNTNEFLEAQDEDVMVPGCVERCRNYISNLFNLPIGYLNSRT